jgi:hypothetical protein
LTSIGMATARTRGLDEAVWGTGGTGDDVRDLDAARMSEVMRSAGYEIRDERLALYVTITLGMLRSAEITPAGLFHADLFSSDERDGALARSDDDLRALILRAFPPASSVRPPIVLVRRRYESLKIGRKTNPKDIEDAVERLTFMWWTMKQSLKSARYDAQPDRYGARRERRERERERAKEGETERERER